MNGPEPSPVKPEWSQGEPSPAKAKAIRPVHIDGTLYVAMAVLSTLAAMFASDESAKYIAQPYLFWLKTACQVLTAAAMALKMFRSMSYGDSQPAGRTGNTQFITRPPQ